MLLFALEILLVALALISCLSAQDDEVRALPRYVWLILILLFPIVGSIVYFAVGRPVRTTPRTTWRMGGGFPESTRPARAPDDDPEFLARMERKAQREDQEILRLGDEPHDSLRKLRENTEP
jgi:hypothetical protein